jgi:hypothetical protein
LATRWTITIARVVAAWFTAGLDLPVIPWLLPPRFTWFTRLAWFTWLTRLTWLAIFRSGLAGLRTL